MVGGAWEPAPSQFFGFLAFALHVLAQPTQPLPFGEVLWGGQEVRGKSWSTGWLPHFLALSDILWKLAPPCISLLSDRLGSSLAAKRAFLASQNRFAWC